MNRLVPLRALRSPSFPPCPALLRRGPRQDTERTEDPPRARRLIPLLALAAVLGLTTPALANPKEAGAALFLPVLLAVVAYPLGLAVHCLILAFAPRRGVSLVHKVEAHRWKTIILGLAHSGFLFLVLAAASEHAPAVAILVFSLWSMLALVGMFGLSRSIGARVLDIPSLEGPGELKALAVGWFVIVFASAFPGLGWLLWLYWSIRATGAVVLTLFSVQEPPPATGP